MVNFCLSAMVKIGLRHMVNSSLHPQAVNDHPRIISNFSRFAANTNNQFRSNLNQLRIESGENQHGQANGDFKRAC